MLLVNNGCYVADVKFGMFDPKQLAGNDAVASKLEAAGFRSVQVQGSGRTRSVSGIWNRPDINIAAEDIDSHLCNIKRIL